MQRVPGRAIRVAGLGALAGCTAGCVSLQTSGPVTPVTQAGGGGYSQIQIWPSPPSGDEQPGNLVAGFLQAARSGSANSGIAAAYLTAAAQQQWKTDQKSVIVVADGTQTAPTASDEGGTVETVSGDVVGVLDAHAQYSAQMGEQPFSFGLTKTDKGYLISSLPPGFGVVLQQSEFESEYAVHDIFFANAQQNGKLIPAQVYLPGTDSDQAVANQLTALVLAGVPARLGDSAVNGVGAATLKSLAFEPDDSVLVTLAGKACSQPRAECNTLALQLAATLSAGVSTKVSSVRVVDADDSASGQTLDGVDFGAYYSYGLGNGAAANDVYAVTKDGQVERFGLNPGSTSTAPQPVQFGSAKTKFGQVAVQPGRQNIALTSQDGTQLYIVDQEPYTGQLHSVFNGTDISSLSWDGLGHLWFTAVSDGVTEIYRYSDGNYYQVQVEGLDGAVGDIAAAPDGDRVAVSYQSSADGYSVAIGTASGQFDDSWTLEFQGAATVADSWTQVLDFGWYKEDTLSVLGIPAVAGSLRLFQLYADGSPVYYSLTQQPIEANPVTDTQDVCWNSGGQPIAATKEGKLYVLSVEGQDAQLLTAGPVSSPSY
ncbi:hypothetical protein KDL01_01905 [Actinospica durhamensis]|uniref:Lipoprotein LpqB N-terminal domain-containing protein n=1 Tax=Actinospica durhamensis TaxID=1508375 RepID=A0A941EKF9_9ACTN|nr:LpqB family beta-propeller domain-containing protein [Actinospica durhamensis]MBR7831993.1 hypothetical protein [Actinospica durhamensis]